MTIYYGRDIETSVDGDLVINERGDIELAESYDASIQLLKMIIASDVGEFAATPGFGANLGTLVGTDAATAMDADDYVTDGASYGMTEGDVVFYYDTNIPKLTVHAVRAEVTAGLTSLSVAATTVP